ncbi:MAG TPA: D-aminoacyl-tRNA deacylase [Kiritimatiellia bacterium]|jgi:D-tyrosyl-tRNA(Tyr) deacylase|nr:D-aminoacyl-tRNA deacylase [Kiritimatiellia bacterium]HPK36641.1 D-aminoacyl-tRNA deacylase [Kiritimatiellia bacterium]HPW74683.1 D-aminoacyl-tRNA deacylase [Kiritimatiellia bacterium]
MKALIQRVAEASVEVEGRRVAAIGRGLLVLLGVTHGDTLKEVAWLARKIAALRIFEDEQGLMNRSVSETGGAVIVVSQFTLYADTRKGNRPSFTEAARPEQAEPLYRELVRQLRLTLGADRVGTGVFGAEMKVRLLNDGPVTVELCTEVACPPPRTSCG